MCTQPLYFERKDDAYKLLDWRDYNLLKLEGSTFIISAPCEKCLDCQRKKARQWAFRVMQEASGLPGTMLTLTFNCLNEKNFLTLDSVQHFIRSLRKRGHKFKYFGVVERGAQTARIHYHLCLIGYRPDDLLPMGTKREHPLYTSDYLSKIWENGFVGVSDLTPQTAKYCAMYTLTKFYGRERVFDLDGSRFIGYFKSNMPREETPHLFCSNALGLDWIKRNALFCLERGYIKDGIYPLPIPRYYKKYLSLTFPSEYDRMLSMRPEPQYADPLKLLDDERASYEILKTLKERRNTCLPTI